MKKPTLPAWLTLGDNGVFTVDPDIAYPAILDLLGVGRQDYDQYWIETAYQCAKQAVQALVLDTPLDPRPDAALTILIDGRDGRKDRWALAGFPSGQGIEAASVTRNLAEPTAAKRAFWRIQRHLLAA